MIEKDVLADPAGTTTEVGTAAILLSLFKVILEPSAGAMPPSVTVPVEGVPPETLDGFSERLRSDEALIVTEPLTEEPVALHVTVATLVSVTAGAVVVNPA